MEMYDDMSDDERLSQLRRRTSQERAVRRRAEFPIVLTSADHRPGVLKRLADSGELVRLTNGMYCAPPPQDWPVWRRRQYMVYARARGAALRTP